MRDERVRPAWEQTDAEIDEYIAATKDLLRSESLGELRARLIRQRDEALDRAARDSGQVIVRALKPRDFYPPPERGHSTTPGVVTLLPRN